MYVIVELYSDNFASFKPLLYSYVTKCEKNIGSSTFNLIATWRVIDKQDLDMISGRY